MRVSKIRETLSRIDGALIECPPAEANRGDIKGVVAHTLNDPEHYSPLMDTGVEIAGDRAAPEEAEASSVELDPVFELGPHAETQLAALSERAGNEIRQSVNRKSGTDALGHYSPFHFLGAQWGVTIKLSGIAYLVNHAFHGLSTDNETKCRLAFQAILQHELFHFAAEVALSQIEISQQQAWWVPSMEGQNHLDCPYLEDEERMANAWMLKAFRTALPRFRVNGKQEAIKRFVGKQPPGYCDALNVSSKPDWLRGLEDLMRAHAIYAERDEHNPLWWGGGYDWSVHFPIYPRIDWRYCVIRLVDDSVSYGLPPGWLTFFSALEHVEESRKFQKLIKSLSPAIQRAWSSARQRLTDRILPGMDFKRFPSAGADIYSVRINDNFRVHLERDRHGGSWTAVDIGSHVAMGHG